MSQTRGLAAILAADVAGYSRLMGADEEGMLERQGAARRVRRSEYRRTRAAARVDPGDQDPGDGLLLEFGST